MIYQIETTQQLNCDIQTAWDFFSSPHNLAKITPEKMNFVIVNQLADTPIHQGLIIDYKVTPLLGIRMKWRTKITQVEDYVSFTDEQLNGPYTLWRHFHEFTPNEEGVMMRDVVTYKLPLGYLGRIAHKLMIRNKLVDIFAYRYEVLEKMFNTKNQS
ncbi:SRPBCC family protein [Sphingobacterium sp. PCS056]|uniref:SRPBCC family protein n=1 Tax=Sphingobacterium sp. PCS056 TaxID=2931400 RepID=UPI00200C0343|nr:SRPBCC family protein [Sphingobacterium sp. PCS056]UPZ38030.1 SRPBCC family protein [Sphingobacterium sp. PCS056]